MNEATPETKRRRIDRKEARDILGHLYSLARAVWAAATDGCTDAEAGDLVRSSLEVGQAVTEAIQD